MQRKFSTLSELYEYVDAPDTVLYLFDINDFFYHVRKNNSGETAQIAGMEREIVFAMVNNKNEFDFVEPLSTFLPQLPDFLQNRLKASENPVLLSRYAHMLYSLRSQIDTKLNYNQFAQEAIDSYISVIGLYKDEFKKESEDFSPRALINSIESAFKLSMKVQYKLKDIQQLVMSSMYDFDSKRKFRFMILTALVEVVIENHKCFTREELTAFKNYCWEIATKEEDVSKYEGNLMHLLNYGKRLDELLNQVPDKKWDKQYGERCYAIINILGDDFGTKRTLSQEGIKRFKILGDVEMVEKMKEIYDSSAKQTPLYQYLYKEITSEEIDKRVQGMFTKIQNIDDFFNLIVVSSEIIPTKKFILEESYKRISSNFFLQQQCSTIDDEGKTSSNSNESFEFHGQKINSVIFFQTYRHEMEINMYSLGPLLERLVSSNVFTVDNTFKYLQDSTWLGVSRLQELAGSKTNEYVPLEEIKECIEYYVFEFVSSVNNGTKPKIMMCTDSLTVKIEGLLRELCLREGEYVFDVISDKANKPVSINQDIDRLNALLYKPKFLSLISEDLQLFLRFFLTEKAGFNFRHAVCHSLTRTKDYSIYNLHALFLCVVIIAMCKVKNPT